LYTHFYSAPIFTNETAAPKPHWQQPLILRGLLGLRSAAMSHHAFDFLQSWIAENVNAVMYGDEETAAHLAHDCLWEAKTIGIAKSDLIEAAGGDLKAFMLAKLDRAVDHVEHGGQSLRQARTAEQGGSEDSPLPPKYSDRYRTLHLLATY